MRYADIHMCVHGMCTVRRVSSTRLPTLSTEPVDNFVSPTSHGPVRARTVSRGSEADDAVRSGPDTCSAVPPGRRMSVAGPTVVGSGR